MTLILICYGVVVAAVLIYATYELVNLIKEFLE